MPLRIVSYISFYTGRKVFVGVFLRRFGRAGRGLLLVWRRNDGVETNDAIEHFTLAQALGQTGVFNHGQFKRVADEFSIVVGVNSAAHTFKNDEVDV